MVYLVGGAPRAGKTTSARRFCRETGIGFLSVDYLKMGIARGIPGFGLDPSSDDWGTAVQLRPVLEGMVRTYVENGEDYLLEGFYLCRSTSQTGSRRCRKQSGPASSDTPRCRRRTRLG